MYSNRNFVSIFILLSSLFLFTSCPSDEGCDDMASSNYVPNLVKLLPEQEIYQVGDVLDLTLSVPSNNMYFNYELDLFAQTNDNSAKLVFGFDNLFDENNVVIIKGSQGQFSNQFNMPYDSNTDSYLFEAKIELSQIGSFSLISSEFVEFIGDGCDRFVLDTNVEWTYTNGRIEFEVLE